VRVAIVHYWFLVPGGGERVVEVLADMYPQADFFVLFADPKSVPKSIQGRKLTTSFLNKLPLARRMNRALFPLYPLAVESFDFRGYDLVISSDSPPIKGLILNQSAVHLCYCHTPGRYLWDYYSEFRSQLPRLIRPVYTAAAQYVRNWDFCAAQRVDQFIANSNYVAERIWKYYRRHSTVIYPPINTGMGYLSNTHDDYYLSVGRLVESKRIDLLIHACNKLGRRLLIAGTGREEKKLKAIAGPSIEFLGRVSAAKLPELYARCRAFLFAADEDFGIVPVEAQAFGRPVVCLGRGGSRETILDFTQHTQPTGLFFKDQTAASVSDAILQFESAEHSFDPQFIQDHARQFDTAVFEERMRQFVNESVSDKDRLVHGELPRVHTGERLECE
jgi:glycosyltransferase involved in cell wall biosynthesis